MWKIARSIFKWASISVAFGWNAILHILDATGVIDFSCQAIGKQQVCGSGKVMTWLLNAPSWFVSLSMLAGLILFTILERSRHDKWVAEKLTNAVHKEFQPLRDEIQKLIESNSAASATNEQVMRRIGPLFALYEASVAQRKISDLDEWFDEFAAHVPAKSSYIEAMHSWCGSLHLNDTFKQRVENYLAKIGLDQAFLNDDRARARDRVIGDVLISTIQAGEERMFESDEAKRKYNLLAADHAVLVDSVRLHRDHLVAETRFEMDEQAGYVNLHRAIAGAK